MTYIRRPHWRSWHLLRTWTRVPGVALTLCGRRATDPETHEGVPAQRTCEQCYRIDAAHREEEREA